MKFNKTLTKEQIKAIRIVRGFNPDTRLKLYGVNRDALWYFIDRNSYGLLGAEFATSKPTPLSDEWDDYERCILNMVNQVIEGR